MTWFTRKMKCEGGFLGGIIRGIGGAIGGAVRGAAGAVVGAITRGSIPTPVTIARGAIGGAVGGAVGRPMRSQIIVGGGAPSRIPLQTPPIIRTGQTQSGVFVGPFGVGTRRQTFGPSPSQIGGQGTVTRTQTQQVQVEGQITDGQMAGMGLDATGRPCPQCCKGFQLNKSSYFLRDGTFVPARSKCVRIRRKDFFNGKAALGSTRRLTGYVKAQRRVNKVIKAAARGV